MAVQGITSMSEPSAGICDGDEGQGFGDGRIQRFAGPCFGFAPIGLKRLLLPSSGVDPRPSPGPLPENRHGLP
jgi:hypothetical protein